MEEELIEAVRKHKILFDTRDPGHIKSKLKDEIWSNIARELQSTNGNAAKSIWLKLRNNHREALRRQKIYLKSGAAATPSRQWKYQKQIDFLLPYMVNRARESNLNIDGTQSSEETRNNTECPGTEVDDTNIESRNA
ncbi:hypothetical protein JTB14_036632 [Gonioctena quinquepunctata]|nr:hypothetical protein JTB14_036632 [Gonioctena quinquepunctata]